MQKHGRVVKQFNPDSGFAVNYTACRKLSIRQADHVAKPYNGSQW